MKTKTQFFLKSQLLAALFLLCLPTITTAQVTNNLQLPTSINEDGTAPDASAILDVQSTDKGARLPSMTSVERDAISDPATGLLIYNTTDSCFNYYSGAAWYKDCGRSLIADEVQSIKESGGGTMSDKGNGIAKDASGNIFVTGQFNGTADFGDTTLTSSGDDDVFTVKYNAFGEVQWAARGGGTSTDRGKGIATDASGNSFVTGSFSGTADFGDTTLTSSGSNDVFTVKYNAAGELQWAARGGGTLNDFGSGIATDASGNLFVTGSFDDTADFGDTTLTSGGSFDVFTVKYNATGEVQWAAAGSGILNDSGSGIATDASGNSFVTGAFTGTADFGDTTLTSSGSTDAFTVKYNVAGEFQWAVTVGGTSSGSGSGIATDASGNILVTGTFNGTADFGDTTLTGSGTSEVFTVKYNAAGEVQWAARGGGTESDSGSGIATDASGNSFVTGTFFGTADFGDTTLNSSGINEVFTVKYNAAGEVQWAAKGGGTSQDFGKGIATDASGNSFVTGSFNSTADFGGTTLTSAGDADMFMVQYAPDGSAMVPASNLSASQITETDPEVGANMTNYLPKWDGASLVQSTSVFEDGDGKVGIGTASPDSDLHAFRGSAGTITAHPNAVVALESNASCYLNFLAEDANTSGLLFGNPTGGFGAGQILYNTTFGPTPTLDGLQFLTNSVSTPRMVIDADGNVGIGTSSPGHPLDMASGAHCTSVGTWTNASDRRLKKDIAPIGYGLNELMSLRPVSYRMQSNDETQIGFIAQEVQAILPELISGTEGDIKKGETLGMSYGNLTAVLVKAVQEQQEIIENGKLRMEKLEAQNTELQSRLTEMDELKQRMAQLEAALLGLKVQRGDNAE